MATDAGKPLSVLRVDGGASVSDVMMQFQSDILNCPIDRPQMVETTALGAAFLADLATGVWDDVSDIYNIRCSERTFSPQMDANLSAKYFAAWKRAVERAAKWEAEA